MALALTPWSIVLAPFPYAEVDRESKRPVCVISSAVVSERTGNVSALMITSSAARIARLGLGDVLLREWREAGLRRAWVARTTRLATIATWRVGETLGLLTDEDRDRVREALFSVLALS